MTFLQKDLEDINNIYKYLNNYPKKQRSTYFEKKIAEIFSHLLNLPFHTKNNDDKTKIHRVIWHGNIDPVSKAPGGFSDILAFCYNFYLVIETTLNTSSDQWAREFATSIKHCEKFCSNNKIHSKDVFILLICQKLNMDTFRSLKNNPKSEYKFVPIEISCLINVIETLNLAFTMRHLEFQRLFHQILYSLKESDTLDNFKNLVDNSIKIWQQDVLKTEKSAIIGINSYRAMHDIGNKDSRKYFSIGEIQDKLFKYSNIIRYFEIVQSKLQLLDIENSLLEQSLGIISGRILQEDNEPLFEPVYIKDFKGRSIKLIKAAEDING